MENELLKGILDEIKSLRKDTVERLDQTNTRIDKTNEELKGLRESVIVLQGGVSDLRYEMQGVKQILGDKVIWQNDNIILQTREGQAIYGVIKRASKE
ncbi:MAG: hypothetical protein HY964_10555 [Ignavibacteriales bacterium]|nr:hypothetical protein [Ignavibacteriales bacterium]